MGISFSTTTTTTTTRRRTTASPFYPSHSHPLPQPLHPSIDYYSSYPPPPPPYHPYFNSNAYAVCSQASPLVGQPYFGSFDLLPPPPVAGAEQKTAKVVNSDVNVHKESLRLEFDELRPHHFLVSFVFDALVDGSITIWYFAREEGSRRLVSLFPDTFVPIKVPFRKGLHQEFRQPSGTGIDLRFFSPDDLSNSSSRDDVFPIIISAETYPPSYIVDDRSYVFAQALTQMQLTQVIVEKNYEGQCTPKVIRQLLWNDDTCYELREIYGLGKSAPGLNESGSGKECVICMTDPKDIAVLPCRHMCMCSSCAKELRLQSNKCPICREIIEALLEIRIDNVDI